MLEGQPHMRFARSKIASSPLPSVPNSAWDRFVHALSVQGIGDVSSSGGYGFLDLRPRRLAELGAMENLHTERRDGRQVWVGDFVPPHTEEEFLNSAAAQMVMFRRSMADYDARLTAGELTRPAGVSRSGALAILHRGGLGALSRWPDGALSDTFTLFQAADGLF